MCAHTSLSLCSLTTITYSLSQENLLKPRRVERDGDVEEGGSDAMAMSALAPSASSGPPPPPTDHAAGSPVEVHDAPLLGAAPPVGGGKEGKAVKPPQVRCLSNVCSY